MFNFFKKKEQKQKQENKEVFLFSDLHLDFMSDGLKSFLRERGDANFIIRSRNLNISEENINKNLEKISLDLQEYNIEYIGKDYIDEHYYRQVYLKFNIGKYVLFIACYGNKTDYFELSNPGLSGLKSFCNKLEKSLSKEDVFVIFDEHLDAYKEIEITDAFLVFGKMYLDLKDLKDLKDYLFLFSKIREYANSIGRLILNNNLIRISEIENKELEDYLNEIKIIGADYIDTAKEFHPLFKKTARLSEITEEIKNLNTEIQDIKNSI